MDKLSDLLEIAKQAAQISGNFLKNEFHQDQKASLNKGRDIKLKIDIESEKLILEFINQNSKLPILSEESGASNDLGDTYWIVDPLDGTTNYIHGIPHWGISIALEFKSEIIAAVIYDPIKDELFVAEKGSGSWLNNRRLRVSNRKNLSDMLFATGVPFGNNPNLDLTLREIKNLLPVCSGIRRSGSAALDLAYVAAGRYDGFWERNLNPWDIAAGILIVKEAGGFISGIDSNLSPLESGNIIASNTVVYEKFAKLLDRK